MAENRIAACCVAGRPGATATQPARVPATPRGGAPVRDGLVDIPGGAFLMGTDDPEGFPADGEGPVREVTVRPFRLARHAVTNAAFAAFVQATGYATEAERFGWSFVFHLFVPRSRKIAVVGTAGPAPWWLAVKGVLARAGGAGLDDDGPARPPGRPRLLARRGGLLRLGGRAPADRGGVGARGARRAGAGPLPWGDELTPGAGTA